ncbi:MAG TPA: M1 family peptidase [Desulfuromonadales bacterium]|nr:M1 family peptidase [Desulfuromonadales bacterium]
MRYFLLLLFFLSLSCPTSAAPTDLQEPVVLHQKIEITLTPSEHLLRGTSTITFAAGTQSVSLKLSPTAQIESVTVSGAQLPYSFSDGTLSLNMPETAKHETVPVSVTYRAFFNDPLPQPGGSSEDPTYGVRGAITTQGTFLSDSAGWYPLPPSLPLKRSIRVSAPAGIEAITHGKRVARSTKDSVTTSSWEELRPTGGLTLCAGPYRVDERREAGVDLYSYFYADNATLSSRYLDAAAKYLRIYSDLFGPYPFEKFAVVENFFPTGYGFPSFTLLGSTIIRLPFIIETSFPHEIVHSWWGNAIEADQSEGNWTEGLTTYLADYLLKERHSAEEGREYRLQLLSDFATLVTTDTDFPLTAFRSRVDPASRSVGYGKSAMLFHMIRTGIGDDAFFGALREICRERLYRSATWDDFTRAFSKSSGLDLSPFMKQWLTRPGGPRFHFSDVTRQQESEGRGWTVSGSIVQTPPFYELGVPLRLQSDGASIRKNIPVTGALTRFSFSTPAEPRQLLLDPDAELFRLLAPDEIPVTVNSIKGSRQLLAVITEDCRARDATFRRLLDSLGKGGTAVIRERELDEELIRRHDLIFCGVPKHRSLLPPLPSGIARNAAGFSLRDDAVTAPDGLLFLVLPFPSPTARIAALFRPLSEVAAEQYASKITHYGKYGSLVFTGGAIRHKGTTPPAGGGSAVIF